jgi:integrase
MSPARQFGTIRRLPSGRYQARSWHLGDQVSAGTTFATKTAARAWLSSVETDLRRGDHVDPRAGTERFGTYARRWLDERDLRPRTRETYESQLKWIVATFDSVRLREIEPTGVRSWHGRMHKSGLSPNTVAKVYRLFRTIMATAVEDGLLRTNPVAIKGAAIEEHHERPALNFDDVRLLADSIEPRFQALIWTAATSALRYSELTGLSRAHVDLARSTVRVERALSFVRGVGATLGAPKTPAAHRSVALPAVTVDLLREHMTQFVDGRQDALIFTSVKGSPLLYRYFAPFWNRAKEAAEIDPAVHFHDLRHLASTTAASSGASVKELMARMGHATSDASLRYLQASERRDGEIARAMQERIAPGHSADP